MRVLFEKLMLFLAYLKVIKNPVDRYEFYYQTDRLADPSVFADIFSKLNSDPFCKEALSTQHRMKPISANDLAKFPEGTLGHAYLNYLKRNKIKVVSQAAPKNQPISYLRSRDRQYHHIWKLLLNYDTSLEDEMAYQAFNYAQINSTNSILLIVLTLLHGLIYDRAQLKNIFNGIADGWNKGKKMPLIWGLPFEDYFSEPLTEVREKYLRMRVVTKTARSDQEVTA